MQKERVLIEIIKKKIKNKLKKYYPDKDYKIETIEEIKPNLMYLLLRRSLAKSLIFRCRLTNEKEIYVKKTQYTEKHIKDLIRLNQYREKTRLPRTLDYFRDINTVVIEGVKGRKLFPILLKSPGSTLPYIKKIGESLGILQSVSLHGLKLPNQVYTAILANFDFKAKKILKKEIGTKPFTRVERKIKEIKNMKFPVVARCGDRTPYNVLVHHGKIYHIDLTYKRDFYFEEIYNWITHIFKYLGIRCDEPFYEQLFLQTGGHPYLSQMLCSKMIENCEREGRCKISSDDLTEAIYNALNGDINLLTILEKITKDVLMQEMLLKILSDEPVKYSRAHTIIYNLQLSGAIRMKDNVCVIKNPIYEKFFRQYFNL